MWSRNLFPALVAVSCSIAFGAVAGTLRFNVLAWVEAGRGASFAAAYAAVPGNPLYVPSTIAITVIAGVIGGLVAARLSAGQAYLNAALAALLYMAWSALLFVSPLAEVRVDPMALVLAFAFPIPCALLGAYLYARRSPAG